MVNGQVVPWFKTAGRAGERSVEEQLKGLELIDWAGKSVADLGCAEGEILRYAKQRGAGQCIGIDWVAKFVDQAQGLSLSKTTFMQGNLNEIEPAGNYDIVLMLAILHKLKRPLDRLRVFLSHCKDVAVIRLPPESGPVIDDYRSGRGCYDIRPTLQDCGFLLQAEHYQGPRGEWMSYWRRREQP